jgi:hypothetical protein
MPPQRAITTAEAKAILKELDKRAGLVPQKETTNAATTRQLERSHRFMKSLHEKQVLFAEDKSTRKAALCTRRAGKTTVSAFIMCRTALEYEGCLIPYITITLDNAKKVMWEELKILNRKWGFEMVFNETTATATFPNGSRIWMLGAKHKDDIERLRGPKYPLVVLDEAASFGAHIENLLQEVLEPALLDYEGTMLMIGTPGPVPAGLFYEVTNGKWENWTVHKWTLFDNPYLPEKVRNLEYLLRTTRSSVEDPKFQREYLGRWVIDDSNLVYRFNPARNVYAQLPEEDWYFNLGIDLGFNDDTAFVVGAYSHTSPNFYVVETYKEPKMDITSVANKIKEYDAKYAFTRKVIDSGALGKMIVAELSARHGLSLEPAEKKDKLGHIENFNSDLLMGRILIHETANELMTEMMELPWAEGKREEHSGYANHLTDACLYAWRDAKHYAGVKAPVDFRTPDEIYDEEQENALIGTSKEHWYDVD